METGNAVFGAHPSIQPSEVSREGDDIFVLEVDRARDEVQRRLAGLVRRILDVLQGGHAPPSPRGDAVRPRRHGHNLLASGPAEMPLFSGAEASHECWSVERAVRVGVFWTRCRW